MFREREEGEDTTKKMLNMQVWGKRRREGYHQEDVKHVHGKRRRGGYHQEDVKRAGSEKEKKERIPPRRC